MVMLGIAQGYGAVGDYNWMLEQSSLTAKSVTAKILEACHDL